MPAQKIKNKIELPRIRIKYKDVFDMKLFYKAVREWLAEYSWKDYDGGNTYETFYGERVDRSGAKEIWIRWRTKKKATEAPFTFYLDFDFHCIALLPAEVIIDGKKIKANKGELDLYFQAFISEDYKTELASHSLLKYAATIFTKRVYRKNAEEQKKALYREVYILQNFIKNWFKMKRYLPYSEAGEFHTSYAYPSHLKK